MAACGSVRPSWSSPVVIEGGGEPVPAVLEQVAGRCDPSREERLGTARAAYAARARGALVAFRRPGGQPFRVFQR